MKTVLLPYPRPMPNVLRRRKEEDPMSTTRTKMTDEAKKKFGRGVSNTVLNKSKFIEQLWSFMELVDPSGKLASSAGVVFLAGQPAMEGGTPLDQIDVDAHNQNRRETNQGGILDPHWVRDAFDAFGVLDLAGNPDDPATAHGIVFTPYQLVELAFAMGEHYALEAHNRKGLAALAEKSDDTEDDDTDVFNADEATDSEVEEDEEDDDDASDDDDEDFDKEDFDAEDDQD